jgi:hypothetical protein
VKNAWALMTWPALLLAPMLALLQQSVTYALVTPSCSQQTVTALHGVAAASVALVVLFTVLAALAWWMAVQPPREGEADIARRSRRRFLSRMATLNGALSALTAVAMWVPIWMLSPCTQ